MEAPQSTFEALHLSRSSAKAAKCYRNRTVGDAMSERADMAEPRPDELPVDDKTVMTRMIG
jgi:transcriptional regulator of met regulon